MKITDEISLRPLQVDDAKDIYDTIDAQREYWGKWLPFVYVFRRLNERAKILTEYAPVGMAWILLICIIP